MRSFGFGVAALLAVSGCAGDGLADMTDDEIADEVWSEISGYESWGRFDGQSDVPVESDDHMGDFVLSYYDADTLNWDLSGSAPDGAVSVKEIYETADAEEPMALTVMRKIKGYDGDNGDWFYAMYNMDGTTAAQGKVEMCIGCHEKSTTDYIFGE